MLRLSPEAAQGAILTDDVASSRLSLVVVAVVVLKICTTPVSPAAVFQAELLRRDSRALVWPTYICLLPCRVVATPACITHGLLRLHIDSNSATRRSSWGAFSPFSDSQCLYSMGAHDASLRLV